MKYTRPADVNVRCRNCKESYQDHVRLKCIYGPTGFDPWRCAALIECQNGHALLMCHEVYSDPEGRCYHRSCAGRMNRSGFTVTPVYVTP